MLWGVEDFGSSALALLQQPVKLNWQAHRKGRLPLPAARRGVSQEHVARPRAEHGRPRGGQGLQGLGAEEQGRQDGGCASRAWGEGLLGLGGAALQGLAGGALPLGATGGFGGGVLCCGCCATGAPAGASLPTYARLAPCQPSLVPPALPYLPACPLPADKQQRLFGKGGKAKVAARKGEADRHIPNFKPKHLLSGKRPKGTTDRR